MTCSDTHIVEIDQTKLPKHTNLFKLHKEHENRYTPEILEKVSKPLKSDRQDINLPAAARSCPALNLDRRVLYLNIKRPSLPNVKTVRGRTVRGTVQEHCLQHAVITDKIIWHRAASTNDVRPNYLTDLKPELATVLQQEFPFGENDVDLIEIPRQDWQQYETDLQVTHSLRVGDDLFAPNVTFAQFEGTLEQVIDKVTEKVQQDILHRNGMVVETNDVLSACTQSQSNVQTLSTAINSKNSLKYMTAYLSKCKVSASSTYALLASVRKDILSPQRKSREEDSGSVSRTAKHFLARVNNMLMKKAEISASQTAQELLRVPVFFTSETFRKVMFSSMHDNVVINRAKSSYYVELDGGQLEPLGHQPPEQEGSDADEEDSDIAYPDNARDNPHEDTTANIEPADMQTTARGFGVCPTYSKPPTIEVVDAKLTFKHTVPNKAVPQWVNYAYRGELLAVLNIQEYASLVDDSPTRTNSKTTNDNDQGGAASQQKPTGLKWHNVGTERPDGTELTVPALQKDLRQVLAVKTFAPRRWATFKIDHLDWDHYVFSNGRYFQPVPEGRKSSPSFEFAPEHPLRAAGFPNVQKLFSLQHIPRIVGPSPPSLPKLGQPKAGSKSNSDSTTSDSDSVKVGEKLDYLGKYYLLLFCPWDDPECGPDYPLNFAGFVEFVNKLAGSTCPWDRGRLANLQCMLDCQHLDKKVRTMLTAYRSQCATRWSEEKERVPDSHDADDPDAFLGKRDAAIDFSAEKDEFDEFADKFEHLLEDTLYAQADMRKLQELSAQQHGFLLNRSHWQKILHKQEPTAPSASQSQSRQKQAPVVYSVPPGSGGITQSMKVRCRDVIDSLKSMLNNIDPFRAQGHVSSSNDDDNAADSHGMFEGRGDDPPNVAGPNNGPKPPNEEQKRAIDTIMGSVKAYQDYFSQPRSPDDQARHNLPNNLYLLHGAAGTGKTNVIGNVQPLCQVVNVATTGIAASLSTGSTTVHSRHKFRRDDDKKKFFPRKWSRDADHKALLEADVYFLDEVSMLNAATLGLIDAHLRHVRSSHETNGKVFEKMPFGGIVVILAGDFMQIPPVRADALYTDVWKQVDRGSSPSTFLDADTPKDRGASLMQTFVLLELKEQQRLRAQTQDEDEDGRHRIHAKMLSRFRTEVQPFNDDEVITYLRKRQLPLSNDHVTQMNTIEDPAWKFATWIVSNNRQVHQINLSQAREFAKDKKTPVFWWPADVKQGGLKDLSIGNQEYIFQTTPGLIDIFVADAPVYLTDQISPPKGLANGTRATLHSLIFTNPHQRGHEFYEEYEKDMKDTKDEIKAAENTDRLVRLRIRPSHVVVRVEPQDSTTEWPYATLPRPERERGGLIPLIVRREAQPVSHSSVKENDAGTEQAGGRHADDKTILLPGFPCQDDNRKHHPPRKVAPWPSVDYQLGFAMTSHKCQGATLDKVIIDMSSGPFKHWDLMMMYVALTRVRNSDDFRLVPFYEREDIWSKRLKRYKMPTTLLSFLYAFDSKGIFDPKRMKEWLTRVAPTSAKQPKSNESPKKASKPTSSAARTATRMLRTIPDPFQNISFVNAVFYALYPMYASHIFEWGTDGTSAFQERFDDMMAACLAPCVQGQNRQIPQTIQNRAYGDTTMSENNVFANIASILPSFRHHMRDTPTPKPGDFITALARDLGWTKMNSLTCAGCGQWRTEKPPRMAIFSLHASQQVYPRRMRYPAVSDRRDKVPWLSRTVRPRRGRQRVDRDRRNECQRYSPLGGSP